MEVKPCAFCSVPFRAYRKALQYCSPSCAMKVNATRNPRTTSRYQITYETLEQASAEAAPGQNRSEYLANKLGCTFGTVERAKRRLKYRWGEKPVELRTTSNYNTTPLMRKYVKTLGCIVCAETRVVDAAHVVAASEGGNKSIANIVPLCPTHHRCYDQDRFSPEEKDKFFRFTYDKLPQLKAAFDTYNKAFGVPDLTQHGAATDEVKRALLFWAESGLLAPQTMAVQ